MELETIITIATTIGGIIYGYLNKRKVEFLKKENEGLIEKKKNTLRLETEVIFKVSIILHKLLMLSKAIRILIIEFHNGQEYYTGAHAQRMTCRHEVVMPNIEKMKDMILDIPVNELMHHIIKVIGDTSVSYYVADIDKLDDNNPMEKELKEGMEFYNCKSLYAIPIRDRLGNITAITFYNFIHKNPLYHDSKLRLTLDNYTKEIQTVFNKYYNYVTDR